VTDVNGTIGELLTWDYPYGFVNDFDTEIAPKGLTEGVARVVSAKQNEPDWLLDWLLVRALCSVEVATNHQQADVRGGPPPTRYALAFDSYMSSK
jgi:hypothetical protein